MSDLIVNMSSGESYTIERATLERESEWLAVYHQEWGALVASNAGARLAREVMPARPFTESGASEWDDVNKQLARAIADELYGMMTKERV